MLPLIAMCDRWDIGGLSTNAHPQTGGPTIFIYDGHPGGVGITRRGYDEFERLVGDAQRLIGECPCRSGCPSCVQSPKCGNLNEPLSKRGALELLRRLQASRRAPSGSGTRSAGRPQAASSLQTAVEGQRRERASRELPLHRGAVIGGAGFAPASRRTSICIAGLWPITITEPTSSAPGAGARQLGGAGR